MINFEEELSRFKPSLEVEEVEDAIVDSDLTDMADVMMNLVREGSGSRNKDEQTGRLHG